MDSGPREVVVRSPLFELTKARILELSREKEAGFWLYFFPILMVSMLALAFRSRPAEALPVAVVDGSSSGARMAALAKDANVAALVLPEDVARQALTRGRVVLVVSDAEPPVYIYDPMQPDSRAARLAVDAALQRAAGRGDVFEADRRELTEPGARYVDFLLPGLLGMNVMSSGMWGIGYSLVRARSNLLLKRLIAAPMKRSDLLLAFIISRLVLFIPEVSALLVFAHFVLDVPVRGTLAVFALVATFGTVAFAGIGVLLSSRARTLESVGGLMNLVMAPMWLCSGIFFSAKRFPDAAQPFIQALPLTALIDGLRAVMLEGAGLAGVLPEIGILAAWTGISFTLALKLFRWQ